jgi:hypothetical protein
VSSQKATIRLYTNFVWDTSTLDYLEDGNIALRYMLWGHVVGSCCDRLRRWEVGGGRELLAMAVSVISSEETSGSEFSYCFLHLLNIS